MKCLCTDVWPRYCRLEYKTLTACASSAAREEEPQDCFFHFFLRRVKTKNKLNHKLSDSLAECASHVCLATNRPKLFSCWEIKFMNNKVIFRFICWPIGRNNWNVCAVADEGHIIFSVEEVFHHWKDVYGVVKPSWVVHGLCSQSVLKWETVRWPAGRKIVHSNVFLWTF